ncbi:YhcN/YlaJ family sporulation lipoprotein [Litchfieldia alkalitelluris]|uniref:YhcN/YlaJ family sporulation lipoprotein n=1 Tax=Litchfieldia alkalitelluris TaxID=304268 RepID=UPI000997620D|nr:YhcN/YlaJ family sporulation lipoprotein [Litchfieldia alkalitelluris]
MKKIITCMTMIFLLAGCNWNPNNEYHAQREDRDGTNLMQSGTRKHGFYQMNRRDEDYNTNKNPHFIDLTENRPTIGDDQHKIAETIDDLTEYRPGSVIINGHNAYVTAHTDKNLSDKERKSEEKKLYKTIVRSVPRYDIHVTIKGD